MTERLALAPGFELALTPRDGGWAVSAQRTDGTECVAGDGAAEALLQLLRREDDLADRWQVLRLAGLPDVTGERAITVDQTNLSVVVGERVIVKWLRSVSDDPQPSLAALAQLSAVGFDADANGVRGADLDQPDRARPAGRLRQRAPGRRP